MAWPPMGPAPDNEVARRAFYAKQDADVLQSIVEEFPTVRWGKLPNGEEVMVVAEERFLDKVDRIELIVGTDGEIHIVGCTHRWGKRIYAQKYGTKPGHGMGPTLKWVNPLLDDAVRQRTLELFRGNMRRY